MIIDTAIVGTPARSRGFNVSLSGIDNQQSQRGEHNQGLAPLPGAPSVDAASSARNFIGARAVSRASLASPGWWKR
jgi:hypothetical protein